MNRERKEFFLKLRENAREIKAALDSKELQLAKLDMLLRQRNETFEQLKDILVSDSIDEEEEELMQEMIEDNRIILDRMEEMKKEMEIDLNKKENDAEKISKYSSENLKG